MNDSWTDTVTAPGVVLIGDAAGYNDAIIGEGLSIALRDARTVGEALLEHDQWSPPVFDAYAQERADRMERLRICASLHTDLRCTFTPAGRAHRGAIFAAMENDPLVAATLFVTAIAGPEAAPAEAFEPTHLDRIHAL
jgi:2-polyprenyl-6-methoxyphenol hydroxylase-like FAD-dependent oxidoreductase